MTGILKVRTVRDVALGGMIACLLAGVVAKGFDYFYPRPAEPAHQGMRYKDMEFWKEEMQTYSSYVFAAALLGGLVLVGAGLFVHVPFFSNSLIAGGALTFIHAVVSEWYYLPRALQFLALLILLCVALFVSYNVHVHKKR